MKPPLTDPESTEDVESTQTAEGRPVVQGRCADAPPRLLEGGGTAFERFLAESTRGQRAPSASLERLAAALQMPSSAMPRAPLVNPSPRAPTTPALRRVISFAGLGALGLIAIVGAHRWLAAPGIEPEVQERSSLHELAAPERIAESSEPSEVQPRAAAPDVEPTPLSARAAKRPPAPLHRSVSAPRKARPPGLREELRALESVKGALEGGRASDAAHALDGYERTFPRGELALEADVLGVEVAFAQGDRERAERQARELLARPDAVRYRSRLMALAPAANEKRPEGGVNLGSADIDEAEVHR
jgi:hypothetical protein